MKYEAQGNASNDRLPAATIKRCRSNNPGIIPVYYVIEALEITIRVWETSGNGKGMIRHE
jgi:hypothetical protein